jgi:hypothetical protein
VGNWTFVSEEYEIENVYERQVFKIAPRLVVGSVLRIDLIGKRQIQPIDDLYYTVFESVKCFGMPVFFVRSPNSPLLRVIFEWISKDHVDYLRTICKSTMDHHEDPTIESLYTSLRDAEREFIEDTVRQIHHRKLWMDSVSETRCLTKDQLKLPVSRTT